MNLRRLTCLYAACAGLFLGGCARIGNDATATYRKVGDRYLVDVAGTRRAMAHDPVSLFLGKTYREEWQFDLPRLTGEIAGREITPHPGSYAYVGSISIRGTDMVMNLSWDDTDTHRPGPISWNGNYKLVEKGEANQAPRSTH